MGLIKQKQNYETYRIVCDEPSCQNATRSWPTREDARQEAARDAWQRQEVDGVSPERWYCHRHHSERELTL